MPAGLTALPGSDLGGGARVVGVHNGVAVLQRTYPLAKGGPMSWEVRDGHCWGMAITPASCMGSTES